MRPTFTPDEIDLICDKYIAQTNEAGCNPKHYDAVREALHSVLRHIVLPLSCVDPAYAAKNPLGGPAKVFRAIAERIEAGEDYDAVLRDYDLVQMEKLREADDAAMMAGSQNSALRLQLRDAEDRASELAKANANALAEIERLRALQYVHRARIQRYSLEWSRAQYLGGPDREMIKDDADGDWVKWEDVERLISNSEGKK